MPRPRLPTASYASAPRKRPPLQTTCTPRLTLPLKVRLQGRFHLLGSRSLLRGVGRARVAPVSQPTNAAAAGRRRWRPCRHLWPAGGPPDRWPGPAAGGAAAAGALIGLAKACPCFRQPALCKLAAATVQCVLRLTAVVLIAVTADARLCDFWRCHTRLPAARAAGRVAKGGGDASRVGGKEGTAAGRRTSLDCCALPPTEPPRPAALCLAPGRRARTAPLPSQRRGSCSFSCWSSRTGGSHGNWSNPLAALMPSHARL